jgi:hypothetical protein
MKRRSDKIFAHASDCKILAADPASTLARPIQSVLKVTDKGELRLA